MESVPTELLVKFLALLNGYEIAKCRRVSRRFDDIVRNTVLLQYLIELDAAGYEDRPNASALSIGERFEALRESQRLWMNADIQAEAQIGPFKIGSEVLGYGQQRCYSDLASVLFVEMQPATDHTVTRIHLALPQYCDAVHVVPEQDLLLTAYGTRLHLLSLATQKQHERASREVLHMQTEFGPSDKMCVLRDLLVILPNEHHLAVYRWTSGELLGTHTSLHTICDVRIANGDFILALTSHNNEQMAVEVLGLFNLWAPSILSHKKSLTPPNSGSTNPSVEWNLLVQSCLQMAAFSSSMLIASSLFWFHHYHFCLPCITMAQSLWSYLGLNGDQMVQECIPIVKIMDM
ncbi:unnamed protein product [Somion occarium]|uniref:F-box domain-containing protein n=1 Tax=Somion occarium TaxID=3059160 RepID=A0ABP1E4Z5_9APHY